MSNPITNFSRLRMIHQNSAPAVSEDFYEQVAAPRQGPTPDQLAALTALPAALHMGANRKNANNNGRRAKSGKRGKLVREGQIVSKLFAALGSRPYPTNGLSLEQSITMELEIAQGGFLLSSGTVGVETYAAGITTISQFSAATALLAVFDQYKIEQVEQWLEFQNPNAVVGFPEIISAVDLDDGNTSTASQIQDRQGAIVAAGPSGRYHKYKPHIAIATFSGTFTSYANEPAGWIDSGSPNVQHYGTKWVSRSIGSIVNTNLVTRIVVTFRAPAIN